MSCQPGGSRRQVFDCPGLPAALKALDSVQRVSSIPEIQRAVEINARNLGRNANE